MKLEDTYKNLDVDPKVVLDIAPHRYLRRKLCATKELQTEDGAARYYNPSTGEFLGSIARGTRSGYRAYYVYNKKGQPIAECTVNIGPALDYFAKVEEVEPAD